MKYLHEIFDNNEVYDLITRVIPRPYVCIKLFNGKSKSLKVYSNKLGEFVTYKGKHYYCFLNSGCYNGW